MAPLCIKSPVYLNTLIWRQPSILPIQYTSNCHKNLIIPTSVEYISLNAIYANMPT
jgi:hypothetical protein